MTNKNIKSILVKAGELLKKEYFNFQTCSTKEKYDLVTESDYIIDKFLIEHIREIYPGCSIFSEETRQSEFKSDKRWIIDPIDGTANFIFGVPYFCISLCLEVASEITEAYVYNPITEQLFTSEKNDGKSYLNDNIIRVSENAELENSLAVFGFSANYKNIERYYKEWNHVLDNSKKAMPLLSPALNICNVAQGRTDLFIDFGSSMEGHAAAALILKNAGGMLLNYDFTEWDHSSKGVIATNGRINLKRDFH